MLGLATIAVVDSGRWSLDLITSRSQWSLYAGEVAKSGQTKLNHFSWSTSGLAALVQLNSWINNMWVRSWTLKSIASGCWGPFCRKGSLRLHTCDTDIASKARRDWRSLWVCGDHSAIINLDWNSWASTAFELPLVGTNKLTSLFVCLFWSSELSLLQSKRQ